jgi:hypothetical protein
MDLRAWQRLHSMNVRRVTLSLTKLESKLLHIWHCTYASIYLRTTDSICLGLKIPLNVSLPSGSREHATPNSELRYDITCSIVLQMHKNEVYQHTRKLPTHFTCKLSIFILQPCILRSIRRAKHRLLERYVQVVCTHKPRNVLYLDILLQTSLKLTNTVFLEPSRATYFQIKIISKQTIFTHASKLEESGTNLRRDHGELR